MNKIRHSGWRCEAPETRNPAFLQDKLPGPSQGTGNDTGMRSVVLDDLFGVTPFSVILGRSGSGDPRIHGSMVGFIQILMDFIPGTRIKVRA